MNKKIKRNKKKVHWDIDLPKNVIYNESDFNVLLLSSLFFVTNSVTAYFNGYYFYSLLFCILTTTSIIVHYNDNIYTNIVDKIAVISIVLYGAQLLYNKININKWMNCMIIVTTFILCVYLYIYGFIVNKFCFCDDKCIAQKYHFIMHIISSIGHHFIIFL
jgi:hypothetical protein